MFFIGYDLVGRMLEEVTEEGAIYTQGVAVFVLSDNEDTIGKMVAEDFSLRTILNKHPELRTSRVVSHNNFFGESVFRVKKEETK